MLIALLIGMGKFIRPTWRLHCTSIGLLQVVYMLTCEFQRVAQSWTTMFFGKFSCCCVLANVLVASGLQRSGQQWRKLCTATSAVHWRPCECVPVLCSPQAATCATETPCDLRQLRDCFFMLAPLSVTIHSSGFSKFQL